jgi:hypothetical protein
MALVPPLASTFTLFGEIEYVQEGDGDGEGEGDGEGDGDGEGEGGGGVPAAACVTVNARPPIVSVPVRDAPVLVPTVNPTEPLPVPLKPDVTVIQAALLAAVHRHPA